MIKLVYVVAKRADISEKDFHEYWLKVGSPGTELEFAL